MNGAAAQEGDSSHDEEETPTKGSVLRRLRAHERIGPPISMTMPLRMTTLTSPMIGGRMSG